MRHTVFTLFLFFILLSPYYGNSQSPLSVCNFQNIPFTTILNQQSLGINTGSKEPVEQIQLFLKFQQWPTIQDKTALKQIGLQFIAPQHDQVFLVSLPVSTDLQQLKQLGITSYLEKHPFQKVNCAQWESFLTTHSNPNLNLAIYLAPTVDQANTLTILKGLHYVNNSLPEKNNKIVLEIKTQYLNDLIKLPYVEFVEPEYGPLQVLNYGKGKHGIHYVQSVEGLTGDGVTVGVGDNGKFDHLDGRNRTINNVTTSTSHGNNICGLISGGGIIDPKHIGYAPKSKIIAERFDDIIDNSPAHYAAEGMVITNNAYGTPSCGFNGWYSTSSRKIDDMSLSEPKVLHVFATGNGGFNNTNCGFAGCGFGSVPGGFQTSKNALTVGNLLTSDEVHPSSSKGPTRDGRIKPEICTRGHEAIAPGRNNLYNLIGGTSSASAAASGGAAILVEQYRRQFNNEDPPNMLIKGVLCNTADDLGNPGPDYTYGFGQLNIINAVNCIKNKHFYIDSLSNGQSKLRTINVPQNTKLLKANLTWNDIPGPIYSVKTLINDLDIQLESPDGTISFPLILDGTSPDQYAEPGVDTLNNIEQILIPNPVPGIYTARINGTSIGSNSVAFTLSYNYVTDHIRLINPVQGGTLVPGEEYPIFWESYEDCVPFKLEYSTDNGSTWKLIVDNLNPEDRVYKWLVPDTPSPTAIIRLTQAGNTSLSGLFNIFYRTKIQAYKYCGGNSIRIVWDTVPNAYGYQIWMLDVNASEMVQIATIIGSEYVHQLATYQTTQDLWFSVVPIGINNERGPRSVAKSPISDLFEEPGEFHYRSDQLTVDFSGISRSPSGQSVTYNWQFGDGAFASGEQVSHTYLSAGQYLVKLNVSTACNWYSISKTIYISGDTSCLVQDSLQLVKFYNQTDGANWTNPWTLTNPVSTWFGVYLTTDKCNVNILQLSNRNVSGKIPDLNLPYLEILNLTNNSLSGKLPNFELPILKNLYLSNNSLTDTLPSLLKCPILQIISIDNNELSGSIPNFDLSKLRLLLLGGNNLSGTIPDLQLSNKLTTVNLADNNLLGTVPDFNLPFLENLYLNNNQLNGQIPEFNNLPAIKYLYLNYNELNGTLPPLSNCTNLVEFFAYSNQIDGSIPDYQLKLLTSLFLHNNKLSGPIPDLNLPVLQNLFLYNNQLSGLLPSFDSIPFIQKLNLSDNKLVGAIPNFGNAFLTQLYLQHNQLTGKVSDLSLLNKLNILVVHDNHLTFDGMLENRNGLNEFLFAPQAKIPVFVNGNELTVAAGGVTTQNTYEWFRNGELISTQTGDSSLVASLPGTYYCKITNADLSNLLEHQTSLILYSEEITLGNPIHFDLKIILEGAYNPISGAMNGDLFLKSLLRGQTPGTTANTASPSPSAHPYQEIPWSYFGAEGGNWTAADYVSVSLANNSQQIVDWVLVSLRTLPNPGATIARTTALVMRDGTLFFPNKNIVPSKYSGPFYVQIEHRNHIGIMTPQPISIVNDTLAFDFTLQDSYVSGTAFGSKEVQPGVFAMYGGEGYNTGLKSSYDINGSDKSFWLSQNGFFARYLKGDYNLDGDINGADRIFWEHNNGVYSSVKRYYP